METGPYGSAWELGFAGQYGKWALRAIVEIEIFGLCGIWALRVRSMSEMEIERYTSPRWRPTDDQIKMMTNIYNYGVTHPSRAQVVEITSRLRAFGDASEYNVHCWFNNHGNRVRRWQAEIDPTGTHFSQLPLYMYEYDWEIMRAPRLLDLFPVPIIIDDDRDERQIAPPMLLTFRTRAPSMDVNGKSD
ncbi:hypothetical protein LR48_Vigan549s008800 [Vigna angularis]|uniref:Homeobox domain-containing protein n=1 Tax=Phaseolus angularis TaxID=3914 RepID=A0A0L9TDD9_PHAAN|nr:hypothetical protein LR48_Vigan549s008800 [Vigna angularis]